MSHRCPWLASLVLAFSAPVASAQAGSPQEPKAQEPEKAKEAPAATPGPAMAGFESVFPEDSILFVGIDDLAALRADWRASAWGRLFADEKAAPVRDAFTALLQAVAAQSKEEAGTDLVEVAEMVTGRFGASLSGRLDALQDSSSDDFGGFVAADAGEHAAELKERVLPAFNRLVERGDAVMKVDTAGSIDFVTIKPTKESEKSSMSLASTGSTLALGFASGSYVEHEDFHRFLGGLAGDAKDTLAQLPAFRTSLAALPGGVKFWFDSGAMLRAALAEREKDDPEAAMQRALGLADFGALSGRFALDAREMRVDAHQSWSGGWLPKLLDAWLAGGDVTLLKLVPPDVSLAIALHLDFVAGVDVSEKASKELGGPPLFGGATEEPPPGTPPEEQPFEPKRDLLDHLDGRVAIFAAHTDVTEALPMLGAAEPMNVAVVLGVKNAEALNASIDRVLRAQGMHAGRKRTEFEGFQIFTLQVMPFTLSYAIADDFAVFSMSTSLLQDVLRRKSNHELGGLVTDAGFRRELDAMTQSNAVLVWTKTATEISGAAQAGSANASGNDEPVIGPDGQVIIGGGDTPPPPDDSVSARVAAALQALQGLDPSLIGKHLPTGSLLGLSVDEAGARLEAVSR